MDIIPYQPRTFTLDEMILTWIHEKTTRSSSQRTTILYQKCIDAFRDMLHRQGLDLDTPDEVAIALCAQAFAASSPTNHVIAPATYNLRISTLSSFYVYAQRRRWLPSNPIDMVDRHRVENTQAAMPLDIDKVKADMQAIDRTTVLGRRDYALLLLLFSTGRRVQEMASMRCGDIAITPTTCTVTWPVCKGGKVMRDILAKDIAQVLLSYLKEVYPNGWRSDSPVWCSQSKQNKGKAISCQSIADICQKHLAVSKVHATRHTFAIMMEQSGAKISDIQARLGHSNPSTTGAYLQRLHGAENQYASNIASLLGVKEPQE